MTAPNVAGPITASGGSKSIRRKNIKLLAGKPLIAWTIEAALQSHGLGRVIVSTDDNEIARISRDYGAEVPFTRPAELATDEASHMSVILHALEWAQSDDANRWDYLMLLQPTTPLRRTCEDIDAPIQVAVEKDADSVISICPSAHQHPYLVRAIREDGIISSFVAAVPVSGDRDARRQALPDAFFLNGAVYITRSTVLREQQTLQPPRTFPYVMPPERSIQVDGVWEWHLLELILADRKR